MEKREEVFNKFIAPIVALLIIGGFAIWAIDNSRSSDNAGQNNQTEQNQNLIRYQGEEGKTALELLQENHEVETQDFSGIGVFVTSIDGQAAGPSQFWSFYVNGQPAQVGAGQYVTKSGDTVEWRLEEIGKS